MSQDRSPLDQAIELLVFAPVGLAISAREALPALIERGRQQVSGQATMAKMVGQFAVKEGQKRASRVVDDVRQQATTVIDQLVGDSDQMVPRDNGSAPSAPAASPPRPAAAPPVRQSSGEASAELAITDYDSLAASQVVPRLSGLTADELELVRAYEAAHRGRKTILSRVAQLQSNR